MMTVKATNKSKAIRYSVPPEAFASSNSLLGVTFKSQL
jgi:hypothetical protein